MEALFRVLLLLGFVVSYWWAILAVLAVVVAGCLAWIRAMHRGVRG